jgi:hypothetical protein
VPPADRFPEADDPGTIAAAAMTPHSIIKARPPNDGSPAQFFSRMRAGRLILQRVKTDVDGSQTNSETRLGKSGVAAESTGQGTLRRVAVTIVDEVPVVALSCARFVLKMTPNMAKQPQTTRTNRKDASCRR